MSTNNPTSHSKSTDLHCHEADEHHPKKIPRREDEHYFVPGFVAPSPEEIAKLLDVSRQYAVSGDTWTLQLSDDVMVKYGENASIAEAKAMIHVKKHTKNVPMPEVLGYYRYGPLTRPFGHVYYATYIFMTAPKGQNLMFAWDSYDESTKKSICSQLRACFDEIRNIPAEQYIGSFDHGKVSRDIFSPDQCGVLLTIGHVAPDSPFRGPFATEKEFRSALLEVSHAELRRGDARGLLDRMLSQRQNRIVFTHGDFAQGNVFVKDGRIEGIIEWQSAGWYPEYWEFVASQGQFDFDCDWSSYVPDILEPYYPEYAAFLLMTRGPRRF